MKGITLAATLLRVALGWYMFADGLQILLMPNWSARAFLLGAKTFPDFYAWFAQPGFSWWVDPLNSWGITLVGVALLLGVAVRPAAWAGAALMLLYYFPHYSFPVVPHGYIVEEHIVDAAAFALIALLPQARVFGVARFFQRSYVGRIPLVRSLL